MPENRIDPAAIAAAYAKHNVRPIRQEHLCDWGTAFACGADVLGILVVDFCGGHIDVARRLLAVHETEAVAYGKPLAAILAESWGYDVGYFKGLYARWTRPALGTPPAGADGPFARGVRDAAACEALLPVLARDLELIGEGRAGA